ncbi:MAG TPA: AAA family ATPase [Phycisphaerales bacterium]|nr:AAA family ATPase [Phycisphaerales bacterium]
MRTIAIINQKGGCGKTTSAINLSAVLARAGKRTLLIDLDPQGHCAAGLGIPEQRIELDIGDAMLALGNKPIDASKLLWRAVRNLDLAPARMRLAGLEAARGGLADLPDKDRRLSSLLEKFAGEYDVAVIDCPPSIGLLTYNALAAADMVIIPVETGFFSLQGATRQVNTVKTLSKRLGLEPHVWLLPTMHDTKNTVSTDLFEEMSRRFKDRVIPVVIRHDSRLREATSFGQSIVDYAPGSMGAEDYGRLGVWAIENLTPRTQLPADQIPTVNVVSAPPPQTTTTTITSAAGIARVSVEPKQQPSFANANTGDNGEIKSVSRAEDVARRAQEFLRRIALGRNAAEAAQAATNGSHEATAVMTPPQTATHTTVTPVSVAMPRQVLTVVEQTKAQPAAMSAGTRHVLGVRETNQGVLFVQPIDLGQSIAIAGSFNGWNPSSHVMRRNTAAGVFELCIPLPAGKHTYRLVVDGNWRTDSHNTNHEPNPFGEVNSVAYVS